MWHHGGLAWGGLYWALRGLDNCVLSYVEDVTLVAEKTLVLFGTQLGMYLHLSHGFRVM